MLIGRQILVCSDPSTDERGHRDRRAHGIKQAETDGFEKCRALFGGADRFAVEMPFL